jgi:hypothetical protein
MEKETPVRADVRRALLTLPAEPASCIPSQKRLGTRKKEIKSILEPLV